MSFYSDPEKNCGESGQWAPLRFANKVHTWRSWRNAAIVIGPVALAFDGLEPKNTRRVSFEKPTDIICAEIGQVERCWDINDDESNTHMAGVRVMEPLVFDYEHGAFSRIYYEEGSVAVRALWVPLEEARFIRAVRETIPYVDIEGAIHQVPAEHMSNTSGRAV